MKNFLFWMFLTLLLILYVLVFMCTPIRPASAQTVIPQTVIPQTVTAQASFTSQSSDETPKSGTYACVLSDNAYFYLSPNGADGVFLLPKTYYVRLLSYGEEYCKVEYLETDAHTQKLTGYVRTQHLAFVDYHPQRPYLNYVFELTYRLESANQNSGDPFTELTFTCAYYGDYPIGDKMWCYVLREGEFGHVPKPDHLEFEENTEYADYLASLAQPPAPQTGKQKSTSSPVQIAILITLCLLVPLLAALILKTPRKPPYEKDD